MLGSTGKARPKHWGLFGFSCEHDTTGGGARWEQDPPAEKADSSATRTCGAASPSLQPAPATRRNPGRKRNRHSGTSNISNPDKKNRPGTTRASDQEGDPSSMSTVRLEAVKNQTTKDIPMQPASQDIWDKKYRLKTKTGEAVDADI